jgi:DNA-directed RNA polymerase specialized sigma24 family protein
VPLGTAKSRVRLGLQRMRAELERARDDLDLTPEPVVAEAA